MFDVAIVGGGLAGATTASHLAEAGHRVVVLERAHPYHRKACGEGLFPRGVAELERLGLKDAAISAGTELHGVRFHAGPHTAGAAFDERGIGLGIRRSELDPLLRDHAIASGAELRDVAVRSLLRADNRYEGVVTESGEIIEARVVVGADGLRSRVRQQAGLDRRAAGLRYGVSAHVELRTVPEPYVKVYFDLGHEAYVTPVGGAVVNVAVLMRRAAMHAFGGASLNPAFRAILDRHGEFANCTLLDEPIAAGPFPARSRSEWRDNLVLVGDAAGFFDAISGEGMATTLVSARWCAEAIHGFLAGDESAFSRYGSNRRALSRNSDLLARLSLFLSSRPALARHSVRNMQRQPATFARLVGVSAGQLGASDIRPRDLVALAVGL